MFYFTNKYVVENNVSKKCSTTGSIIIRIFHPRYIRDGFSVYCCGTHRVFKSFEEADSYATLPNKARNFLK
jgi:hypothetical protein